MPFRSQCACRSHFRCESRALSQASSACPREVHQATCFPDEPLASPYPASVVHPDLRVHGTSESVFRAYNPSARSGNAVLSSRCTMIDMVSNCPTYGPACIDASTRHRLNIRSAVSNGSSCRSSRSHFCDMVQPWQTRMQSVWGTICQTLRFTYDIRT